VFALKIAKSGGIFGMLRTAAVGDAAGIALYGGTMLEGSVGTIAAAHGFCTLPQLAWGTELFGPLLVKDDIVVERPCSRTSRCICRRVRGWVWQSTKTSLRTIVASPPDWLIGPPPNRILQTQGDPNAVSRQDGRSDSA
jgi:hypothetical protein